MNLEMKLLVIDDEAAVREAISDIMETVEITVLQAQNGQDGLDMLAAQVQEIGAVLLDMRMPGLSGAETLCQIRINHPGLYVIVSTGYSIEIARKSFGADQPDEFLSKPYDIMQLIDRVQFAFSQTRNSK